MDKRILMREDENIQISYEIEEKLKAPINKGEIVGMITYHIGDEVLRKIPLITKENVPKIDYRWCFSKIIEKFLVY